MRLTICEKRTICAKENAAATTFRKCELLVVRHRSTRYLTPRPAVNNMRETNFLCKGKYRCYHVPQVRTADRPSHVRRRTHMRSVPSNALRSLTRNLTQGGQACLTLRLLVLAILQATALCQGGQRTMAYSTTPHGAPHGQPQPMCCIQRAVGSPCQTKHTSTPCFHLNSIPSCPLHPTSAPPQHQSTGYLTPRPAVNNMRETNLLCKGKCRRYHVPQVRTAGSAASIDTLPSTPARG